MRKKPKRTYVTTTLQARPRTEKLVTRKEFEELQKLLFTLQQLSQSLVSELNLDNILGGILKTLGQALGSVWVNIWELTPDGRAAYIKQGFGRKNMEAYVANSRAHPLKLGTAWIGRALLTKRPWGTSDLFKDPRLPRSWIKPVKGQGFHAILCVPQIVESAKVIGGMCVYFDRPKVFTDFEMRLITVAANQAAVAIVNSRIYGDLLAERDKTSSMIQSLNEGVILYDVAGQILLMNPKAKELLWIDDRELIGKPVTADIGEKDVYHKNVYNISRLVLIENESREYITEGPHKVVLEVTVIPVRSAAQTIGSMRILRDITREKEVDIVKSNFISVASHQLRTPLTGIRWALDTLRKGEVGALTSAQGEVVEKVFASTVQSINLVNDLLNASRIEEGRLGYSFTEQDIMPTLAKIIDEHQLALEQRKLTLQFSEPSQPLPQVSIDPEKFSIALGNILDNAIRYSLPDKAIALAVRREPNQLVVEVKDQGIGIPEADQKFIFIKFFRAKNATQFQTEGSGLGLYIAKSIIEAHNGHVGFKSVENKGSTFFLSLPLDPQKMPKSIEAAPRIASPT